MKWKKENLIKVVSTSKSIAECLRMLKLDPRGSNYRTFKKYIKQYNIDTAHFSGQAHGTSGKKVEISLDKLLTKNGGIIDSRRKYRLIHNNILKNSCYICNITSWMNKDIVLQIDHINGDHSDNRIDNLRLLCPNCHSQTETFAGKNSKKEKINSFCKCGKEKSLTSKQCVLCYANTRIGNKQKIKWPSIQEVLDMVANLGFVGAGKKLGVSDNSVRKFINKRTR